MATALRWTTTTVVLSIVPNLALFGFIQRVESMHCQCRTCKLGKSPFFAQLLWELFLFKYESKLVSRKPASGIMEDDVLCLFCTRVGLQNRLSPIADDLKVGGGGQLAFFNVLAVNEW